MIRLVLILAALFVIVTVALADDSGLLRSSDNLLDCKKVDCDHLQFSSVSLAPDAYLTLHSEPLPTDRISLAAGDSWVRLNRIIRALIEHDPAFADEVLKRERATYRYQDGRTLGHEAQDR